MTNEQKKIAEKLDKAKFNIKLAPYTSFKIGGPAKYFFVATNNKDIIKAIKLANELRIKYFLLGGGTNILVADQGYDGLVIKLENNKILIDQEKVWAESGVRLQKLISETFKHNLTGFEFLISIPGTLGAGVAGNVGTAKKWIGSQLSQVEILNADNQIEIVPKLQCDFSYRYSRFKYSNNEIILAAEFLLKNASQESIQSKIKEYLDKRTNQPANKPCAGSVFKNPEGKKAWQLIDEVGLRGKQIGGAKVSEKHSNFIINTGQATAEDVVTLISLIKQQVRSKLGIQLQEEINYIGF